VAFLRAWIERHRLGDYLFRGPDGHVHDAAGLPADVGVEPGGDELGGSDPAVMRVDREPDSGPPIVVLRQVPWGAAEVHHRLTTATMGTLCTQEAHARIDVRCRRARLVVQASNIGVRRRAQTHCARHGHGGEGAGRAAVAALIRIPDHGGAVGVVCRSRR
jgi:hypothetical protein